MRESISLAVLKLMVRQPGKGKPECSEMTTSDIEMLDWMDAQGIEPGDTY